LVPSSRDAAQRVAVMTLKEALAIAAQVKPKHRQSLDKLQGSTTVADVSAGVTTLRKSFDAMGGTVGDMQKRLDQMRADLDHIENSPGAKRTIH
jgi:hypothetical protein